MSPARSQLNACGPRAILFACATMLVILLVLAMPARIVSAGEQWPYPGSSGRGHFDQYQRTLVCHVLLRDQLGETAKAEQRTLIEEGIGYTLNFAAFLLESGNVVDQHRAVLTATDLPAGLQRAETPWHNARSASGVTTGQMDEALTDCLDRFGHDWE